MAVPNRGPAAGAEGRGAWVSRGRRWLTAVTSFPAMLTVLLLTVNFVMLRGGLADPDIWWHLRNAEYLWQNHQLPNSDLFSFTVAGQPWMNHEWLSEIPYYLAWRSFGLPGIQAAEFAVIGAIFLGLLYLCYRESGNFKASVAACCFATFLATVSFGPRTILFGYLYLVLMLIVLQRFRLQGRAPLWTLPPLFCLWVNTHGSWLLGLILFSIFCASGLMEGEWGHVESKKWTPQQLRQLILTWAASAVALFANPFGWRLVVYPFDLAFRQKLNIEHVAEWVPVNFHELRGKLVLVLLVALLLSALVRGGRWGLAEVCMLLFALYSGLTYIRFLFLLAVIVAPLLAKMLDFFPPYQPELETPILNAVVILGLMWGVVHFWPTAAELQESVDAQYPTKAIAYMDAHPAQGPMLNFYLWGGYLGWNRRDLKVFVDSRVDIFEYAGVLQDYIDVLNVHKSQAVLEKYKIQSVLFPRSEPLTYVLQHDPAWKAEYSDSLSVLLVRQPVGTVAAAGAVAQEDHGH